MVFDGLAGCDFWTYGPMDLWTCGPMDLWTYGPVNLWTYGPMDLWTYEPMNLWTYGPMDLWTYGPMDLWTYEPVNLWTYGPMDLWTYGPMDLWTYEPMNQWNLWFHGFIQFCDSWEFSSLHPPPYHMEPSCLGSSDKGVISIRTKHYNATRAHRNTTNKIKREHAAIQSLKMCMWSMGGEKRYFHLMISLEQVSRAHLVRYDWKASTLLHSTALAGNALSSD